jgi:urease accessory protein
MKVNVSLTISVIVIALMPNTAMAHLVSSRFGEFYNGMLHPTTTLMHIIPWLALGFLCGFQGLREARKILVVFPVAVVVGAIFANFMNIQMNLDYFNLASTLILGAGVVLARTLPPYLLVSMSVIFGISHGFANANADLVGNGQLLYLAGVMVAAYLVVCLTSAGVVTLTQKYLWGKTAVRATGSWIFAVGILFSGFSLLQIQA